MSQSKEQEQRSDGSRRFPEEAAAEAGEPTWGSLADARTGRFHDIRLFREIDSTNSYLNRLADAGAQDGIVAVAEVQTAGRGRLGRSWTAPPGSALLVSLLVRPALPAERCPLLALAAGVAMSEAVQLVSGVAIELKWPNDLRVQGRKLGGILVEARTGPQAAGALIVGAGVNLKRVALPGTLADTATSLEAVQGKADRDALLPAFLAAYDEELSALEAGQVVSLIERFAGKCETIGQRVRIALHTASVDEKGIVGTAVGVDSDGALRVRLDSGNERSVRFGEVGYLRPTVS